MGEENKEATPVVEEKPWYKSLSKVGTLVAVLAYAAEKLGPIFGYQLTIPNEFLDVLGLLGVTVAGWGFRNAIGRAIPSK